MSDAAPLWEERWHPLKEEWVIVAAHRQRRPWSGETLAGAEARPPPHDPDCYLCPRATRVHGDRNPDYAGVWTFDNDLPCVGAQAPDALESPAAPFRNRPARGVSRVVCYTPRHDRTLAELTTEEVVALLCEWQHQYLDLGARDEVVHVHTFENKGEVVGVSNPHPHCQIYATNFVFRNTEVELRAAERHSRETGRVLFQDILRAEQEDGRRLLVERDTAVAFVPYFARYAYETFVAPRATHASIAGLSDGERQDLAETLRIALVKLDNLWRQPMPYILALHQAPTDGAAHEAFHFHIEIHPPLRLPGVRKYLAGCEEGGGNFLSDTSPEAKAAELRSQPETHFCRK